MTFQAEIGPRLGPYFAVRIMARCTVETDRPTNLVWMGQLLLPGHIRVTAVADMRSDRAHRAGRRANGRVCFSIMSAGRLIWSWNRVFVHARKPR
jgi:hypothetical protein